MNNKNFKNIVLAAKDQSRISGATHRHYRYPASFSHIFAETVIKSLSKPGDIVLDPFVGGGTSAVSAIQEYRNFYGLDINPISIFISESKLILLSKAEIRFCEKWIKKLINFKISPKPKRKRIQKKLNGMMNLKGFDPNQKKRINEIKNGIEQFKYDVQKIKNKKIKQFLTCVLMRASKRILDNQRPVHDFKYFISRLEAHFYDMVNCVADFEKELLINKSKYSSKKKASSTIVKAHIAKSNLEKKFKKNSVCLVVTSPPYPRVNISYNRWQIHGRRDTILPYWIIDKEPPRPTRLNYSRHHTNESKLEKYFSNITAGFKNIKKFCKKNCYVVQLVSFRKKSLDFKLYLKALEDAGLKEIKYASSRLWRKVPKRRWQAVKANNNLESNKEVLLIHKFNGSK